MLRFVTAVLSVLLPGLALAHTGSGGTDGLAHGFAHPFGGLDHVLAMVAVGVLAAELGRAEPARRVLWTLPAAFLAAMAAGGALGLAGEKLPFVEIGIAGSVLVLGLLVALPHRVPRLAAGGLVVLFAAFHGHAHGAEMPVTASGLGYGLGFLSATLLLHLAGIALGLAAVRLGATGGRAALRWAGVATSVAGGALLVGLAA